MIEDGDRVTVHYELSLEPGQPVETTFGEQPETFHFGRGEFPAGLEKRLAVLDTGEVAEFVVPAEEMVFGAWDPENRHAVDRTSFEGVDCSPGSLVEFELPNGERVNGRVESGDDDLVVVDFNNPLAGRDVYCRLQLVNVEKNGPHP